MRRLLRVRHQCHLCRSVPLQLVRQRLQLGATAWWRSMNFAERLQESAGSLREQKRSRRNRTVRAILLAILALCPR